MFMRFSLFLLGAKHSQFFGRIAGICVKKSFKSRQLDTGWH